ncbi:hypothetical protein O6H91_13G105200 [Diphasiastrum complanatum]|uniref:Uncharacterized protein n=1 Tax=Diphasiastrum complanatum TaxID=34168 RepID=A0ACC2BZ87_DIPCM|nr:hypothetical protein O6H91_13G105200 [Diphasiastrum complanatum]
MEKEIVELIVALALAFLTVLAYSSPTFPPFQSGDRFLNEGQVLNEGEFMVSANDYYATMHRDCLFAVHDPSARNGVLVPLWYSPTQESGTSCFVKVDSTYGFGIYEAGQSTPKYYINNVISWRESPCATENQNLNAYLQLQFWTEGPKLKYLCRVATYATDRPAYNDQFYPISDINP